MMLAFSLLFTKFAHIKTGGVPYALFSFDYGLLSRPLGAIDPVVGLLVFLSSGHV